MLRVLAAYLRCDRQTCSMVRVPTPEEEDVKRTHRERVKPVQERLRFGNRIEALLFTQGIRKRPSLRSWERDLAVLRTGDGREIPRHLRAELDRLRRRIMPFELGGRTRPGGKSQAQDQACHWKVNLSHIRAIGENFAAVLTSLRYYITTARLRATSAALQCLARAEVWIAIGASAGRETRARTTVLQIAMALFRC
jgi:transposase